MSNFIFVGEKPSNLAFERGVTWRTGGLAARTLHDALDAAGIDPAKCGFMNLFGTTPDAEETVHDVGVGAALAAAHDAGCTIVAMGQKVQKWLGILNVPYVPLIHPAARGKIRAKEAYQAHVKETLTG